MIDKAIMIMMFMYAVSFSFIGTQYILADLMDMELTDINGNPVNSYLLGYLNTGSINSVAERVTDGDYDPSDGSDFDRVLNFTTAAAFIAWDLVGILTGAYIFNIMLIFGIPTVFVVGFAILYIFMLIRAVVALIRGV